MEQDNVFDEAFNGTWQALDGIPDAGTFEVTRWAPDDNSYRVVLRDQADVKHIILPHRSTTLCSGVEYKTSCAKQISATKCS
jgi:hypothetical protein